MKIPDFAKTAWSAVPVRWEWKIFGLAVLAALGLSRSYGMAWDEAQHAIYGSYVWDYFLSGCKDMRWKTDIGGLYTYGTLFDLPSAIFHRMFASNLFEWRSFFMAVSGALAIPAVAKIGRRLGGETSAVAAVAALLLMPQFVGQSFINCKDIPLAAAVAWSVLGILRVLEAPSMGRLALLGVIFGLTLSVRIGGAVVGVFFVATLGFCVVRAWLRETLAQDLRAVCTARLAGGFVLTGVITWALLVAFWPYAQQDPLRHPIEAFQQATAFPIAYPVLYLGQLMESTKLPWHYLPLMLFLTAPLGVMALFGYGLVDAGRSLIRGWRSNGSERIVLLLFWLLFPVLFVWVKKPNIYDGVRHFLFLLPAIAVLAGLGAAKALEVWNAKRPKAGTWAVVLALGSAAPALFIMHPYQYSYYNLFAGSRATLHERFETDYWATSYREAAKLINKEGARQDKAMTVVIGLNELSASCFTHFATEGTRTGLLLGPAPAGTMPAEVDFYTTIPRYQMWRNFPTMPLYEEIRRGGILMNTIRSREPRSQ
jgi:Dolichyl-phosphate-mannose-protein mannosyltransferase